jgi:c-di-AMP phosphodiesterase-like protein
MSCPKLLNFAFSENNVETALTNLMVGFINDDDRNKISKNNVELSKIFDWFSIDFTKNGTLVDYLNKYASIKVSEKASIKYLTYDWSLNIK